MKVAEPINRNLFNIYLLFTREPFVRGFSRELEFYANADRSLIGLISLDLTDMDFAVIVLSRDKSRQYRAENITVSIETIELAREEMEKLMSSNTIVLHDNESEFFDLFKPSAAKEQLNPFFETLENSIGLQAAKEVIKEVSYHYKDIDGIFINQFQSNNGFDARLWELYLFCLCREEFFSFKRNSHSPDFMIEKDGVEVAIEAVTVGRTKVNPPSIDFVMPKSQSEVELALENDMPLKFSSVLFDKMKKKYWELPHVKDKPFVLAIADFHDNMSMTWSFSALTDYLYGLKFKHHHDENGKLVIESDPIPDYTKPSGAKIPSGFFFQPSSENVSAVIFSNTATIGKFNRMGKQAGLGSPKSTIIRIGFCHNFEENATQANFFQYEVDENSKELWSEGVSIFHNPNALIPLYPDLFPSVAHHFLKDGLLHSVFPPFFPYNSLNQNLVSMSEEDYNALDPDNRKE